MPALIFDCDGVLADTERFGHLPAFNQTFAELGVPMRWTEQRYGELLAVGGGKERMRAALTPDILQQAGIDEDDLDEHIAAWHRRKTAIYTERVRSGAMPPRPGVARLSAAAEAAGWQLAVASTSAPDSVRAVLEHAVGDLANRFQIFAGDAVPAKKPAPDIYALAVQTLGIEPRDAVAVEDSRNGMLAALAAGLSCLVTTSSYTHDEDFGGAALVVSSLGDADGEPTEVLDDPHGLRPAGLVDLTILEQIHGLSKETR
jgi:HAD superfamily hydrolase (TIGR01509 family)